jgi:hypothetical protein
MSQGARARAGKAQPSAALQLAAELNGSAAKLNNAAVLLGFLSASTSEARVRLRACSAPAARPD